MNGIRARHGEIRDLVIGWLEEQPLGTEFHYGDIADDLSIQKPSVSAIVNRLMRTENPILGPGRSAGRFKVIRPVDEIPPRVSEILEQDVKPEPPGAGSVMEVIGVLMNDNRMLRAEDGSLWEASPR